MSGARPDCRPYCGALRLIGSLDLLFLSLHFPCFLTLSLSTLRSLLSGFLLRFLTLLLPLHAQTHTRSFHPKNLIDAQTLQPYSLAFLSFFLCILTI